jgi:hypothetical protein
VAVGRHAARFARPLLTTLGQTAGAIVVLLPLALPLGLPAPAAVATALPDLVVLGVLATALASALAASALRRMAAGPASVIVSADSLVGLAGAVALLGERPAPVVLLGGALVLLAIAVAATEPPRAPAPRGTGMMPALKDELGRHEARASQGAGGVGRVLAHALDREVRLQAQELGRARPPPSRRAGLEVEEQEVPQGRAEPRRPRAGGLEVGDGAAQVAPASETVPPTSHQWRKPDRLARRAPVNAAFSASPGRPLRRRLPASPARRRRCGG